MIDSIFKVLENNFLYTCLDHYKDHVTGELEKFTDKYNINFEYTFLFYYEYVYPGHKKTHKVCGEPTFELSKMEIICLEKWIKKLYDKKVSDRKAAETIIRAGILYFNWR